MNALSVNSISNSFVRTAVAQQRVAVDRGNVVEAESQLINFKAKLDEDLTYLSKLQKKNHEVQHLDISQAQSTVLNKINQSAQVAQRAAQQASSALSSAISTSPSVGTNINIVA
ncbi:MAG: hypothetical protein R8K20_07245 [Gallionellaceae bacterium]